MTPSHGLQGRLNIGYQGSQYNQVGCLKMGSSGRNDNERVLRLDACPARWQGRNITEAVAIKEQVIAPVDPSLHNINLFSEKRVKGVGDSDRRGHFSGATCS